MQKRSKIPEIRYQEIGLDPRLPIAGGAPFRQHDRPITFLHAHECLEIGYCYSGSGVFMVGEKILPFRGGDVSFISRLEVHLARSAPGTSSEWTWIYLDPILLGSAIGANPGLLDPSPLAGPDFNNILTPQRAPRAGEIVRNLVEELKDARAGREEILRALAWQLMIVVRRLAPKGISGAPKPEYERIVPALQHMAENFFRPVDVPRLARLCHLSMPHFRRVFGKTVGQSPREYWLTLRLRLAASLLRESPLSILEISHRVGFETLSSFNRLFLAHFGKAPRSWRRGGTE